MAYVKISDPSIIDLSAWHQVINVINQHSDTIDAITNNFGSNTTPDWNSNEFSSVYQPGNQQIVYGRSSIVAGTDSASNNMYNKTVSFSQAFKSQPIVTATVYTDNGGSGANNDTVVEVRNVGAGSFTYRIYRTGTTKTITGTVHINWTAIGPS